MSYDRNEDGAAQKYESDLAFWQTAATNNAERSNRYYCLLLDEYHLRTRSSSPWECESAECPRVGKLADKNCGCFADKYRQHMRQIAALPGESE